MIKLGTGLWWRTGWLLLVILLQPACAGGPTAGRAPDGERRVPAVSPTPTALRIGRPSPTPSPDATPTSLPRLAARVQAGARPTPTATPQPTATAPLPTATATVRPAPAWEPAYKIIGFSAAGHAIEGWELGDGPTQLVFVGGMHGGYEWNTIQLAYQMLDYFVGNPQAIPPDVTLVIIPVANPDGQVRTVGWFGRVQAADVRGDRIPGRFNSNGVDLNRNWDCNWEPVGVWGSRNVSAGSAPFSEPETFYLRDYLLDRQPALVVFWHSDYPGVFPGTCGELRLADTDRLGQVYATASGYPYFPEGWTDYPITGDASDYLTTVGIPSFAVELASADRPEGDANLAAMLALLALYR